MTPFLIILALIAYIALGGVTFFLLEDRRFEDNDGAAALALVWPFVLPAVLGYRLASYIKRRGE